MIDEYIKRWLIKAMEDFRISKHELSYPENEIAAGAVCFHCQQLVEKLLKAYLVSKNIEFRKTHELEFLLDLCLEQDNDFAELNVDNLTYLTSYAVEIRYTDNFYIPSVDEAKECFEIASTAMDFILRKLGVKEGEI